MDIVLILTNIGWIEAYQLKLFNDDFKDQRQLALGIEEEIPAARWPEYRVFRVAEARRRTESRYSETDVC